uniref:C2H2-type domain-containing protein n=1 Tax=Chlamydomonas leiostraca TaxID=1034604 RepID=A0A7S0WIK2_9CHLO|mmetsp:Transcript_14821/g.36992  ORF Transcript_14821/g.36992 Transcript_14821/m.36992 type:complete len:442 (+) Transcript_14821:70-1395(+)
MGKNDFLTPKAIANRIKAKGLQKLRWYCQLCQKQCRDENGFKCHQMSDGHRRQMEVFGMNPGRVVAGYSEEFEQAFLDHLKRAHPFSRVLAKNVYNEYINDKHHVHMNSTRWLTLTEFVKYLGREGKCKVDETEKGWWITLIHRDPMQDIDEEKRLKRTAAEKEEEERHLADMSAQLERARKMARLAGNDDDVVAATELVKREDEGPLVLSLAPGAAKAGEGAAGPSGAGAMLPPKPRAPKPAAAAAVPVFGEDDDEGGAGPSSRANGGSGAASGSGRDHDNGHHAGGSRSGAKESAVDRLMRQEMEAKARERERAAAAAAKGSAGGRGEPWVVAGIVVKVMSKELEGHGYYKKKGVVDRVVERYVGEVEMLDSGDVVRVDQAQLETVIPQPGGAVLFVSGPHRGSKGKLQEINTDKYQAKVQMSDGRSVWAEYEEISKLA